MDNTETLEGKYLTFKLDTEEYGLGILKVQEIIGILPVTHVPRVPEYIRGVVNLRGKVIPVVDLRVKFGMEVRENTERTCIIVVQVQTLDATVVIGIVVDEVSEVLDIKRDQIEPPPSFGTSVDTEFILGIGKVAERVVLLLDIDRVLVSSDAERLEIAG